MSFLGFAIATSLQAATPAAAAMPPMPEDLNEIPIAEFRNKPTYAYRESLKAKKLTKGCEPTRKVNDGEYYFVSVVMLTDGAGGLKRVTPVSIDCPPLEEYVARYFARTGKDNMQPTADGKPAWRRTMLKFYW
ncbi:hypothetical protein SAMN02745824_0243 [Parasphingorhabdus marina DSM 22363]|uniref:TonB protein C-terminal n=1 Tax=Parasphingorhabdus marina DSM 22363 TaxID=1123272 RepID=A0A1N6CMA7_9SPHN|nr:hypothetical protein [Parasphingorhabdus marina]SIN59710.1 hypothetical protein SAMN02745824_0243 [Parasphingorhabdus marina DSM 22363]